MGSLDKFLEQAKAASLHTKLVGGLNIDGMHRKIEFIVNNWPIVIEALEDANKYWHCQENIYYRCQKCDWLDDWNKLLKKVND